MMATTLWVFASQSSLLHKQKTMKEIGINRGLENESPSSAEADNMRDLILYTLLSDFISDWLAASMWHSVLHLFAV